MRAIPRSGRGGGGGEDDGAQSRSVGMLHTQSMVP